MAVDLRRGFGLEYSEHPHRALVYLEALLDLEPDRALSARGVELAADLEAELERILTALPAVD